jgi:hypothetical protein
MAIPDHNGKRIRIDLLMANIFDTLLDNGVRRGIIPAKTEAARTWYRETAQEYKRYRGEVGLMRSDTNRLTKRIRPGNLYMYFYDAKTKEDLPYWDRFPMVFPFRVQSDRFWGINLHYLPLPYRAKLMDALYQTRNNSRYDETTRLRISYQILKSASKFRFFEPCVKQYLFTQMKSQFFYIQPEEWDVALFLPLERFQKKTKTQVFAESRKTLAGSR